MAVETYQRPLSSPLERAVDLARLHWEAVAYIAIVALSVFAHLWGLDRMAMHHDESIHAWSSWRFYTGSGGFNCWGGVTAPTYCYDPVYHGPALYMLTLVSYFLFGDGDAQARLPMAMAGIGMVASCWWLRPYLGRRGALVAAVLLGFSPSLLYFTRFARHDGLMVLWEIWMVIGIFRWLDSGKARWLYLTAAGIALAIGTHELYYILFFIFGVFVLVRLLSEGKYARFLNPVLLSVIGLCLLLIVFNRPLPIGQGLYLGEKAFLVASAIILAWLCQRLWDPTPRLTLRLQELWYHHRPNLWIALAILGAIYLVQYTTFFAYPRGALDGLYAGLAYWLGSQQEYARGDQPWFYYIMQLPLYEPIAVLSGIGVVLGMVVAALYPIIYPYYERYRAEQAAKTEAASEKNEGEAASTDAASVVENPAQGESAPSEDPQPAAAKLSHQEVAALVLDPPKAGRFWELFPLFLVFWFFAATIIFSWAGEKMPWLLVHMALPGNLLAAWAIGRMFDAALPDPETALVKARALQPADGIEPVTEEVVRSQHATVRWLAPLATLLLMIALGVAFWRLGAQNNGQDGQSTLLQGIVPLLVAFGLIYGLLTLANRVGMKVVLALSGLTLAALLGAYTLRATWMAVYEHPDTAVELLVYTQTAPDVPRYVRDIRELALNLTRNQRSGDDVTGGLTMPILIDSGDDGGEGSLAWPLQWYLRDFKRINWIKSTEFQNNTSTTTFETTMPDGSTALAPVVLLYKPHVTGPVREVLEQSYSQPYGSAAVFNWWFPEGSKCAPGDPGYKRFYYSTWTPDADLLSSTDEGGLGGCGRNISDEVHGPLAPILWPFDRNNWDTLYKFLIYRELPSTLVPGAREMEFWLRSDLAGGSGTSASAGPASLRLVAQQSVTLPTTGTNPTGITVDGQGNIYIADTLSHQVHVYNARGELVRSIGSFGQELGQFNEPRGLAVDAEGNLYVSDTWNARIVKFNSEGEPIASWGTGSDMGDGRLATMNNGNAELNQANPLGFFGPRGLALDPEGNLYIADTGNQRIVVTSNTGEYLYQIGYAGAEPGAFNEPAGVAVDAQGNVYVADTWNSRVQVFAPDGSGQVGIVPIVTWRVSGWQPNTYNDPSIAASPDGTVYVSVPTQNQVLAANLRGDVLLRWGGAGSDFASLNSPSGMAVAADGSVWVVDRSSDRALRFELPQVQPLTLE